MWCTFVYDTGSKSNYVSVETLKRLGIDHASSRVNVTIDDVKTFVYSSDLDDRLEGINVIGDEYLSSFDCRLTLEYKDGVCTPTLHKI